MENTSLPPVEDTLGLGVVPQQIALVVGQIIHGAYCDRLGVGPAALSRPSAVSHHLMGLDQLVA